MVLQYIHPRERLVLKKIRMRQLIKENKTFYLLWISTMLIVGALLPFTEKGDFSLWLNFRHSPIADHLFRYATWMGDGITVAIMCFVLLFVRLRWGIAMTLVSFCSAFLVSLIKKEYNEPRPSVVFENMDLHYVNGLELYRNFSFPSGHTAAAFTMFLLLSFFFQDRRYTLLFFILACIVAVSRVYLMQHFLIDVYFGALFGVLFGTLLYWPFATLPFFQKRWASWSLFAKKG